MGPGRRPAPRAVPGARLILRKRRYAELVGRQLDLWLADHRAELDAAGKLLDRYDAAGRDDAEELYGDYLDAVGWLRDALEELRDGYARTLEPAAAAEYLRAFDRDARRRRVLPPTQ